MKYFYVAQEPGKIFVAVLSFTEIKDQVDKGILKDTYYAAEERDGQSFRDFQKTGTPDQWRTLATLLAESPAADVRPKKQTRKPEEADPPQSIAPPPTPPRVVDPVVRPTPARPTPARRKPALPEPVRPAVGHTPEPPTHIVDPVQQPTRRDPNRRPVAPLIPAPDQDDEPAPGPASWHSAQFMGGIVSWLLLMVGQVAAGVLCVVIPIAVPHLLGELEKTREALNRPMPAGTPATSQTSAAITMSQVFAAVSGGVGFFLSVALFIALKRARALADIAANQDAENRRLWQAVAALQSGQGTPSSISPDMEGRR